MNFLDALFSFVSFIVAWVFTLAIAFVAWPLSLLDSEWGQECHRLFGVVNLRIMDIRLTVIGLQNLEDLDGAVLAPNHESLFDILVIASLPFGKSWVAKRQIFYIPFIGLTMKALGCEFVTRNKSERDIRVLGNVEASLQRGNKIVIFPEGTRTRSGQLLPLKRGAFRTAINAGVPIVPMAITGTFEIAPPGDFPTRSHPVVLRIGTPLQTRGATIESLMAAYEKELRALLRNDRILSNESML